MSKTKIKVLIVHETRLVCSLMAAVLNDDPDIQVVGYSTTAEEVKSKASRCDVILVDANFPEGGALSITKSFAEKKVNVIVIGLEDNPEEVITYVESGADGFVLASVSAEDMVENIRAVCEDQTLASPEIVSHLFKRLHEIAKRCADQEKLAEELENLTPREHEVLALINEGLSNNKIGEKLSIETGTVKNHVHNILSKLEVQSRYEAASVFKQGNQVNKNKKSEE